MDKLKKIITQLSEKDYGQIENGLVSHKSEKFLLLFQTMRKNGVADKYLLEKLHCNENALYVLKSRLYSKVQKHLTEDAPVENSIHNESQSALPSQLLFEYPRETAIAILEELEKKYMENDVPGELIDIYSALKKAHYNTDKYYVYSQLYNKQVAYTMALEKAEDVLFNFNKTLSNYYFSRSESDLELLKILRNEINTIFALNQSHRIELIKNCAAIQALLYTPLESVEEAPLEDLIEKSEKLITDFPNDKQIGYYGRALQFFRFEYYLKINQLKKAQYSFDALNKIGVQWLLMSPVCQSYKFLLSKICFLTGTGKKEELGKNAYAQALNNYDFYTEVVLRLYAGLVKFYQGRIKEASCILNELINEVSFKDFFHIETEIKLTLAYFYIRQNEFELAENLIKSVSRKITDTKNTSYGNAKAFMKLLSLLMDVEINSTGKSKIKPAVEKFNFSNTNGHKILEFLQAEINGLAK